MMKSEPSQISSLVLVPTRQELDLLSFPESANVQLCGFGPIAAAARTAQLIGRLRPAKILLVGIAGTFSADDLPVGNAFEFSYVASDGIGIGSGAEFRSAGEAGWMQWPEANIGDIIELSGSGPGGVLLTVCGASAGMHQAQQRIEKYAEAVAEDMEGFGVAMASKMANVPVRIVRGISNMAGDRNYSNWAVEPALKAANQLALKILESECE